jgi:hypothetical protein
LRIDVDDGGVRRAAICNPRFRAVDDVFVAFADGFGGQCGGVGAGLRLGEREATDFFAAGERYEEFFPLFVSAEVMDGRAVQRILGR